MIKAEDAISNLKNQIMRFEKGTEPDLALKMAIRALEQESVLGKIRAEIAELQKDYQEYGWAYDDALEIIDKYIEADKEVDE